LQLTLLKSKTLKIDNFINKKQRKKMNKITVFQKTVIISLLLSIIISLVSYIIIKEYNKKNSESLIKTQTTEELQMLKSSIETVIRLKEEECENINKLREKKLTEKIEKINSFGQNRKNLEIIRKISLNWEEKLIITDIKDRVIYTNTDKKLEEITKSSEYLIKKTENNGYIYIVATEKQTPNYNQIKDQILSNLSLNIYIATLEDEGIIKKATILYSPKNEYTNKSLLELITNRNIVSNIYTIPSGIIFYKDKTEKIIGFIKNEKLNYLIIKINEIIERNDNLLLSIIPISIISFVISIILFLLLSHISYVVYLNKIIKIMEKTREGEIIKVKQSEIPKGIIGKSIENVSLLISKLEEIVLQIAYVTKNIFNSMQKISEGNKNLSIRTQKQASSLEEVGTAIEELTATAKNNVLNMENAKRLAQDTKISAEEGGEVVYEAVSKIDELEKNSKEIKNIIGIIEEIAFQTNLLALNASVEAARAGEEGKGFAVVAQEIRKLAKKTSGFAKQISQIITETTTNITNTTNLVNNSGIALQKIIDNITELTNFIEELTAAFEEERKGVEEIQVAIIDLQKINQDNAELAENISNSSNNIIERIETLESIISFFNIAKKHTEIIKSVKPIETKNLKIDKIIDTKEDLIDKEGELEEF